MARGHGTRGRHDGDADMSRGALTRAMGSAMGARLGMAVLNYGLFWLLSHRLGASALGGYSLVMNVFYLCAMLPLLGLSGPLTRRAATEREHLADEYANAIAFAAPVAVALAAAIAWGGPAAYGQGLALPFLLLGASMLPTAATLVSESVLMGLERMPDISRIQFAEAALRTAGAAWIVSHGGGLDGVFVVFLGLRVATAVAYRFHPALPRFEGRRVTAALQRRQWQEVPVFLGIVGLAALTSRLDMIGLARGADLREVGRYAAASRLYEATLMLPTIAAFAMMPTLARLFATERDRFREMLVLALRVNLGVGAALALAVAALAGPIVALLYKPELASSAPVLRWLIFGAVLMTLDQILSSTMMAAQAQAHDLRALAIAVTTLAVGLWLCVPHWQALGAAIAVVAALVARVGYRVVWVVGLLQLRGLAGELARVGGSALAGVAALVVALPMGAPLALVAALGAYAVALVATGVLRPAAVHEAKGRVRALFGKERA